MMEQALGKDTVDNYKMMAYAVKDQVETEKDLIANLSNISAFINFFVKDINWAGFYLMKDGELVLGPFQGKPACIRIKLGKGVCGTAAETKETQVVKNVHEFKGHIACDSQSLSEIVIPIMKNGEVFGVLDIDSPYEGRFTEIEKEYLTQCVKEIEEYLERVDG